MSWLFITLLAYLLLAISSLADKYILKAHVANYKAYAFFIGFLSIFVLPLVPFFVHGGLEFNYIFLAFLAGAVLFLGLYWFYKSLQIFEPSRIVPIIGAFCPIFISLLIYVFSDGEEALSFSNGIAFIFLVLGGLLLTYEKTKISYKSILFAATTAFLFGFYFVLAKYVYGMEAFWTGFILIRVGTFLTAVVFLIFFFKEIKKEFFAQKIKFQGGTVRLVIGSQIVGTVGVFLQNWAIALSPLVFVAVISALQAVQYVFIFMFAALLSWKFPKILKEDISKEIIFQKISAIILIAIGLAILAL
ncbi:hypothetical protein BWK69_01035 [Candidatus Parcubacteria bacterium A4]|nr:MAG: hypothetical protein BWK69_01035 [Candidatus Parcubacteria bacterium A4]